MKIETQEEKQSDKPGVNKDMEKIQKDSKLIVSGQKEETKEEEEEKSTNPKMGSSIEAHRT